MKSFVGKIYAYKFLENFLLILPFFAVMLLEYGMSPLQIGFLFFAWSASQFLLEVPSGIFADKYPRKYILIIAQVLQVLCFLSWFFFPTFVGFLIGFILWGASDALSSGTFEALVYDELKSVGKEDSYVKVAGRAGSLQFIASTAASLIAIFAIALGYDWLLLLSAGAGSIGVVVLLTLPRVPSQKGTNERKYFAIATEGLRHIFADLNIAKAVVLTAIISALSMGLFQFWPLIASLAGVPQAGLAIFLAAVGCGQAVASFFAHKLERLSVRVLYALLVSSGVTILLLPSFFSVAGLSLVVAFNVLITFLLAVFKAKLQQLIPSQTRATILSAMGLLTQLGVFAICLVFGVLAEAFSYQMAVFSFGVLTAVIGLGYFFASFFTATAKE